MPPLAPEKISAGKNDQGQEENPSFPEESDEAETSGPWMAAMLYHPIHHGLIPIHDGWHRGNCEEGGNAEDEKQNYNCDINRIKDRTMMPVPPFGE